MPTLQELETAERALRLACEQYSFKCQYCPIRKECSPSTAVSTCTERLAAYYTAEAEKGEGVVGCPGERTRRSWQRVR